MRLPRTIKSVYTFLLLLALVPGVLHASDSLVTWKGQIRARGEVDGRDFEHSTPANSYALLRTRLGADIHPTSDLLVTIIVQDSRIFGQPLKSGVANTTGNLQNIDLFRGFLKVSDFLADGLSLQVGRMGMSYGDERIVGFLEWANTGRSFDGGLIRYEQNNHEIDLFLHDIVEFNTPPTPVNRATVAGTNSEGFLFTGGHWQYVGVEDHTFSAYGYYEWSRAGETDSEIDRKRWTLGGRIQGGYEGLMYEGEGAYQLGSQEGSDVSAFMGIARLGYSFEDSPLSRIVAGFDWLSGTPVESSKVETFDPMFGTNHKFYGIMDYFAVIPVQTHDRGLQDMYLTVVLNPMKRFSVSLTGHYFRLSEVYIGRQNLGKEIDLVASVIYNDHVSFHFGAAGFFPDEIMKFEFGGEDPGWWGYATVLVDF